MTRNIQLTDDTGAELTTGNTSGLNEGLYKVTTSVDPETNYIYIGLDGKLSLRIESVNIFVTSAGAPVISGEVQYYNEGTIALDASWIKRTSYDFSYNAAETKLYNTIFTDDVIDGTPMRIKLTTTTAAVNNIYIKALKK